jgi:hypothetical protein
MSIFGNIMSSIFGHAKAKTTQAAPAASGKTSGPAPSSAGGKKSSPETTGAGSTASSSVSSATFNTKSATAPTTAQPFSPNSPAGTKKSSTGADRSWT